MDSKSPSRRQPSARVQQTRPLDVHDQHQHPLYYQPPAAPRIPAPAHNPTQNQHPAGRQYHARPQTLPPAPSGSQNAVGTQPNPYLTNQGLPDSFSVTAPAADTANFYLEQPYAGHADLSGTSQAQDLNLSHTGSQGEIFNVDDFAPFNQEPFSNVDPFEGLTEYDPSFTFPTSLEEDNGQHQESGGSSVGEDIAESRQQEVINLLSDDEQVIESDGSGEGTDGEETQQTVSNSNTANKRVQRSKRFAEPSMANIRFSADGSMEWNDKGNWKDAVYHNDIRAELIAETENMGEYVHPRAHGAHPLDITSFHPDQASWGPKRSDWATMPHKILFRLDRAGFPEPDYKVGHMMHDGRVVLDSDNVPVNDYRHIPKTLASNTDAYLMECISRLDTRIQQSDFRARMPTSRLTKKGLKPTGGMSFIGQRLRRFRVMHAIVPWKGRENSEKFKNYVKGLLSAEGLRNNSTEELDSLSKLQQEEIFSILRGKHLSRAGGRALTPEERKKRAQKHEEKIMKLKDQEADETNHSSEHQSPKRKRSESDSSEDQGQKRTRLENDSPEYEGQKRKRSESDSPEHQGQKRKRPERDGFELEDVESKDYERDSIESDIYEPPDAINPYATQEPLLPRQPSVLDSQDTRQITTPQSSQAPTGHMVTAGDPAAAPTVQSAGPSPKRRRVSASPPAIARPRNNRRLRVHQNNSGYSPYLARLLSNTLYDGEPNPQDLPSSVANLENEGDNLQDQSSVANLENEGDNLRDQSSVANLENEDDNLLDQSSSQPQRPTPYSESLNSHPTTATASRNRNPSTHQRSQAAATGLSAPAGNLGANNANNAERLDQPARSSISTVETPVVRDNPQVAMAPTRNHRVDYAWNRGHITRPELLISEAIGARDKDRNNHSQPHEPEAVPTGVSTASEIAAQPDDELLPDEEYAAFLMSWLQE